MKPFLLIAGHGFSFPYDQRKNLDWIGCFPTKKAAQKLVKQIDCPLDGWYYTIKGKCYDWYEIVDLREEME